MRNGWALLTLAFAAMAFFGCNGSLREAEPRQATSPQQTKSGTEHAQEPALVMRIQRSLTTLGYDPGPTDGAVGGRTREAIRAFQADRNLPVTGEPSPELALDLADALTTQATRLVERQQKQKLAHLKKVGSGSGFFVDHEGHILTNRHVVGSCTEVRVQSGTQQAVAQSVAEDRSHDLSLLSGSLSPMDAATFRSGEGIRPGDEIVALGFPLHGLLASSVSVTTGTVSNLAGIRDDRSLLQITAPIQPGNSGGPLLDESANVVGVVVGKLDARTVAGLIGDIPQNVNFAVNSSIVRLFLDSEDVDYQLAPSENKLPAADVAEEARRFTVLVECWK